MRVLSARPALRAAGLVALVAAVLALGFLGWLRFWPRVTPGGQPPLAVVTSVAGFRDAFNARSETTTILALLSPT